MLGPNCAVFTDDGRRVEPGSRRAAAWSAVGGFIPLGYYKDEAKSAQTFRTIEGRRWSVPGDFAEVNADGTLHLLGRGSVCINTGGEKVFPEEVEEALKTHPAVRDAVVRRPARRALRRGDLRGRRAGGRRRRSTSATLSDTSRRSLAAYKAPRHARARRHRSAGRANGKVDYKRLKEVAAERAG